MTNANILYEWEPQPGTGRLRLILEGAESTEAIRVERTDNDLFLIAPDSRIIAALVHMQPLAAAV